MTKRCRKPKKSATGQSSNASKHIFKNKKRNSKAQNVQRSSDAKSRKPNITVFGKSAPSAQLRLPQNEDITAAELIAFLPNSLRLRDVLFRFLENGLNTLALANLINHHRKHPNGHPVLMNSLCKIVQKTMRDSGYEGWTASKHMAGEFKKDTDVWDKNKLSLAGLKLHCEESLSLQRSKSSPIDDIAFASLAIDVEQYPCENAGDGLDLTRCVKYAAANAHFPLQFPRDFGFLIDLTGGPASIRADHRDTELFDRWKVFGAPTEACTDDAPTGFDVENYRFTDVQKDVVAQYLDQMEINVEQDDLPTIGDFEDQGVFTKVRDQTTTKVNLSGRNLLPMARRMQNPSSIFLSEVPQASPLWAADDQEGPTRTLRSNDFEQQTITMTRVSQHSGHGSEIHPYYCYASSGYGINDDPLHESTSQSSLTDDQYSDLNLLPRRNAMISRTSPPSTWEDPPQLFDDFFANKSSFNSEFVDENIDHDHFM